MRILLIAGGWSNEREVSLKGAEQIHAALQENGHAVDFFDLNSGFQKLAKQARTADFAFINLHGLPGEDGSVQALLQNMHVPFQGAGARGSLLALNKALAKQIFLNHGLPTPKWRIVPCVDLPDLQVEKFPAILKPNTGGSSLGIEFIKNNQDLQEIRARAPLFSEMLLEEYVPGEEMTCAVLGETPLPPILIRPRKDSFFDYKSKYEENGAEEICPAPISPELDSELREKALHAHNSLQLSDYSRTDFLVDEAGNCKLLEINTLPGMTKTSLVPQAAAEAGYGFRELIEELVRLGQNSPKGNKDD